MEVVSDALLQTECITGKEHMLLSKFIEALGSLKATESKSVPQQTDSTEEYPSVTSNNLKLLLLSNLVLLAAKCGGGCNSAESILKNLIQEHKLIDILIDCLDSSDRFVAYSASKTLATFICSVKSQVFGELATLMEILMRPFHHLDSSEDEDRESKHQRDWLAERTIYPWEVVTTVLERMCIPEQDKVQVCTNHHIVHTDIDGVLYCCTTVVELLEKPKELNTVLYLVNCGLQSMEEKAKTNCMGASQLFDNEENQLMSILLLVEACLNYTTMKKDVNLIKRLSKCEHFFVNIVKVLYICSAPEVYKKCLDLLNLYLIIMNKHQELQSTRTLLVKLISLMMGNMLERAPYRDDYVGFGGSVFSDYSNLANEYHRGDLEMLKKLAMLVVTSCELSQQPNMNIVPDLQNDAITSLNKLSCELNSKLGFTSKTVCDWLFHLYTDQDSSLIGMMFALLRVYNYCTSGNRNPQELFVNKLDPHEIFHRFLRTVAYDHSVLLDLLISNETEFLAYFVQYLHSLIDTWSAFMDYHSSIELASQALGTTSTAGLVEDMGHQGKGNSTTNNTEIADKLLRSSHKPEKVVSNHREDIKRDHDVKDALENVSNCKKLRLSDNRQTTDITVGNMGSSPDNTSCAPKSGRLSLDNIGTHQHAGEHLKSGHLKSLHHHPDKEENDSNSDDDAEDGGSDSSAADDDVDDSELTPSSCTLDKTMTTLIRLRLAIERLIRRDLFPFRAVSLLRLLEDVEGLYEN
ncbi:uncharacterized protein LOC117120831 isoform X2 [Anneissia japonica]|nr:uncharacterized protein LOC117120831 isoform X2 [Anneissia japonica]